jgi:hypothetical protein
MKARTSIAFIGVTAFVSGVAGLVSGCEAIMDLGRFGEAISTGDSGPGASVDAAPAGPFDCLAQPSETVDPGAVTLHLLITNGTGTNQTAGSIDGGSDLDEVVYTPTPGVTVVPCLALDPGCANPVDPPAVTDDGGIVNFALTGNFVGFFHGTAPGIIPFTFVPGRWQTGLKEMTYGTADLTASDEQLLNAALGGTVDLDAGSGLGEAFVVVYDCFDHKVAGVKISLSRSVDSTLPFYIQSGVPSTTAGVTDDEGVGGALNVPEGTLTATATFAATGATLGSVELYVRRGELTYGWIRMRVH